jgi:hypothetical protein
MNCTLDNTEVRSSPSPKEELFEREDFLPPANKKRQKKDSSRHGVKKRKALYMNSRSRLGRQTREAKEAVELPLPGTEDLGTLGFRFASRSFIGPTATGWEDRSETIHKSWLSEIKYSSTQISSGPLWNPSTSGDFKDQGKICGRCLGYLHHIPGSTESCVCSSDNHITSGDHGDHFPPVELHGRGASPPQTKPPRQMEEQGEWCKRCLGSRIYLRDSAHNCVCYGA